MHEDHFRHSTHPTIHRVWKERIEPFIQDDIYTVNRKFNVIHIDPSDFFLIVLFVLNK